MRSMIVGFAMGAAWLQTRASLPVAWVLLLLAGAALCIWVATRMAAAWRFPTVRSFAFAACGALAGSVWAAVVAQHYLDDALSKDWEGRDVTVIGTIDSLPYRFEQGVRFNLAVERVLPVNGETPAVPSRLALSWYSGFGRQRSGEVARIQPGERWQLTVRLRRPHGNANPNGFDYEVWLLEQKLRATGYVRSDRHGSLKNQRLDRFVVGVRNIIEYSRGWLRDRIETALPDSEYAGVIVALVVGDQRAVSQSDWNVFNRTGIGHLISISGLHITMIAGIFAGLFQALWRRSFFTRAQLPLLLPSQKVAALAGAVTALIYVLLAGFGVPAQRTLYMLSVVALALWFDRITNVSYVLCMALFVAVLLDPWSVLAPGFWLSFGAVAMILYASAGKTQASPDATAGSWHGRLASLKTALHTQYVVTLGLVPLTMLLFGQISLVSPLANAVAIPLISVVVMPLSLLGSVAPAPVSAWLLQAAHGCVAQLASVLTWLSGLSQAVWTAPVPEWWIFIAALIGTIWLLAPRGWPLRWLGFAGWVPLLLNTPAFPKPGAMWVTAFDVGQGMALLIETPGHRLLYDTGPYYSPESDGGNRVILPYLRARGIDRLDGMIISHNDNDHSGGARSLLADLKVDWVSSSAPASSPILRNAVNYRRCEAGQAWRWGRVQFDVLHPSADSYDNANWKSNARSCTLKINDGRHAMLLPGDIEAGQESELVDTQADKLKASVLLAPHHGSGTSSTMPFLQAVAPELALFQVGYRNRYHHPKQKIFDRYGEMGIRRLRTDESGAVTLDFGQTMNVSEYRTAHARYWYGR